MLNLTVRKAFTGLHVVLQPHLGFGLQSDVFHPAFLVEVLYDFLMSVTRVTFPTHLFFRDLALELDICIIC